MEPDLSHVSVEEDAPDASTTRDSRADYQHESLQIFSHQSLSKRNRVAWSNLRTVIICVSSNEQRVANPGVLALTGSLGHSGMLLCRSSALILFLVAFANASGSSNPQPYSNNTNPPFDVYVLALSWPPSVVPIEAHSRARHIMHQGEANAGFWTHGLWPTK